MNLKRVIRRRIIIRNREPQKILTKKEVCKLETGTVIEVCWENAPNNLAMILEKPKSLPGDMTVNVLHNLRGNYFCSQIYYYQIAKVVGKMELKWPKEKINV